jgi:hypothetical protein
MNKATEILSKTTPAGADQKLYKLDPPMEYERYSDETEKYEKLTTEYVIVSAVMATFNGPETYIFPADANGNIITWGELDGSFTGALDHEQALRNAGYIVEA